MEVQKKVGRPKVFNAEEVINRRRAYAKRYYHEKKKRETNKISLKGLAKIIKEESTEATNMII